MKLLKQHFQKNQILLKILDKKSQVLLISWKYIGASYLIYLGIKGLLEKKSKATDSHRIAKLSLAFTLASVLPRFVMQCAKSQGHLLFHLPFHHDYSAFHANRCANWLCHRMRDYSFNLVLIHFSAIFPTNVRSCF